MKLMRLIKRDLRLGLANNIYKYLFVVIVVIECSIYHLSLWNDYGFSGIDGKDFTLANVLLCCIRGEIFRPLGLTEGFALPIYWLCFQLGIHYIIAYYAQNDFKMNGRSLVLASGSRSGFWISKCVWCFTSVMFYYVVTFLTAVIFTASKGGQLSFVHDNMVSEYSLYGISKYWDTKDALILLLLVVLTTFALCLLQITISLFTSAVVGFACMCVIYVSSAFYNSALLPGNYTMLLRTNLIDSRGVSPYSGLVLSGVIIALSFAVGHYYIKKADIF